MKVSIGDFMVCMDCANAFFNVAKEVSENKVGIDFLSGKMYPYVVNCAFACELYIKAIMIYNSKKDEFYTGHNLEELFNMLPQKDKEIIEQKYNSKSKKPLMEFLAENGTVFVEWRYALEKTVSACISGLSALSESLNEYTSTLGRKE